MTDITAFEKILTKQKIIFFERRKKYGNHLENAKRFPFEDKAGLYLKCVRLIREIENGVVLDEDTLIDVAIYAGLTLSAREE